MKPWTMAQLRRVVESRSGGASWVEIAAECGHTPEATRKAYFRFLQQPRNTSGLSASELALWGKVGRS